MSKFYVRWQLNPLANPPDPEERVKIWMKMLEEVRKDIKSGVFKDWAICSDMSAGYCTTELDEAMLHTGILKYVPYIAFDIKLVLSLDQSIESIKRAVAAAKAK